MRFYRSLPSNDQPQWYSSGPSTSTVTLKNEVDYTRNDDNNIRSKRGNRGRKLNISNQFYKKGKICEWNPNKRKLELDKLKKFQMRNRLRKFIPEEIENEFNFNNGNGSEDDIDLNGVDDDSISYQHFIQQPTKLLDAVQNPSIKSSLNCDRLKHFEIKSSDVVENEKELSKSLGRAISTIYDSSKPLNQIQNLFVSNDGINLPTLIGNKIEDIHLSTDEQQVQVQRHIETLHEALNDSREFIERINELRSIINETIRIKNSFWRGLRESVYFNLGGDLTQ